MRNYHKTVALAVCLFLFIISGVPADCAEKVPLKEKYMHGFNSAKTAGYFNYNKYPFYSVKMEKYAAEGYKPGNCEVVLDPGAIRIPGNADVKLQSGIGGRDKPVFVWNDNIEWAEWEFDITSEGLYQFEVEYFTLPGSGNSAVRSLEIDGEVPFIEAGNIVFYRTWRDDGEPVENSLGDEVRPPQVEVPGWSKIRLIENAEFVFDENLERLKHNGRARNALSETERRDKAISWLKERVFYNRRPCELNIRRCKCGTVDKFEVESVIDLSDLESWMCKTVDADI